MFKDTKAFSSFSVDNVQNVKQFYSQTLGLNVEEMDDMLGIHLANGGEVMIYPKPNHTPATFTVLNLPVGDVEAAVDRLTALGVRFEQYDDENLKTDAKGISRGENGPAMAWFKDPAGNILSVMEEM